MVLGLIVQQYNLTAQNCPIDVNDCSSAYPIGDDFRSGATSPSLSSTPEGIPGCQGPILVENPNWFSFEVLTGGMIDVEIFQFNCENGQGLVSGLYDGCGPGAVSYSLQCACTRNSINHTASLQPGIYYILISGCIGDLCNYEIEISGDIRPVSYEPNGTITTETPDICPFDQIVVESMFDGLVTSYQWFAPSDASISPQSDCTDTVSIVWGNTPGYIYVEATRPDGSISVSDSLFIALDTIVEVLPNQKYCGSTELGWFYPATQATLPAGDYRFQSVAPGGCAQVTVFSVIDIESPEITKELVSCEPGQNKRYRLSIPETADTRYNWTTINGVILTDPTLDYMETDQAGTYTLQVFSLDSTGQIICAGMASMTLTQQEVDELTFTTFSIDVGCTGASDGGIIIRVDSGEIPLSYNWSDGEVTSIGARSGLSEGDYQVTVSNGLCEYFFDFTIVENPPLEFTGSSNFICSSDTVITAMVVGGSGTYFYSWSTGETTASITVDTAGTYTVTVTDDVGCQISRDYEYIPTTVDFEIKPVQAGCDSTGGSISVISIAGTNSPEFEWSNGGSGPIINNIAPGTYSVTLFDGTSGCEIVKSATVTVDQDCFVQISGYVYDDQINNDCIADATSDPVSGVPVSLNTGETVNTNANGFYNFEVRPGVYEVSIAIDSTNIEPVCIDPIMVDASSFTLTPYGDNNFYVKSNGEVDLGIKAGKTPPVPGQINTVRILVANTGDQPASGTLRFIHDELQIFKGSPLTTFTYDASAREVVWTFSNFQPGRIFVFEAFMETDASAPIGAVIDHEFEVSADQFDANQANNTSSCQSIVQSSAKSDPFMDLQLTAATVSDDVDLINVKVYPNPFRKEANLEIDVYLDMPVQLELFDYQGRRLLVDQFEGQVYTIKRAELPAGIYWYRLSAGRDLIKTDRLIIQ